MSISGFGDEYAVLLAFVRGWDGFAGTHDRAAALVEALVDRDGGLSAGQAARLLGVGRTGAYHWLGDGGSIETMLAEFRAEHPEATAQLSKQRQHWRINIAESVPASAVGAARVREAAEQWADEDYDYSVVRVLEGNEAAEETLKSPSFKSEVVNGSELAAFAMVASLHFGADYRGWAEFTAENVFAIGRAIAVVQNRLDYVRPALRAIVCLPIFARGELDAALDVALLEQETRELIGSLRTESAALAYLERLHQGGGDLGWKAAAVLRELDPRPIARELASRL